MSTKLFLSNKLRFTHMSIVAESRFCPEKLRGHLACILSSHSMAIAVNLLLNYYICITTLKLKVTECCCLLSPQFSEYACRYCYCHCHCHCHQYHTIAIEINLFLSYLIIVIFVETIIFVY